MHPVTIEKLVFKDQLFSIYNFSLFFHQSLNCSNLKCTKDTMAYLCHLHPISSGNRCRESPGRNIKWRRSHRAKQRIIVCLIGVMTYLHPPPPPAHSSSLLLPSVRSYSGRRRTTAEERPGRVDVETG